MVAPAVILGAKVVVGKIAEQVAIQAAAELLLRRILPGRGGTAAPADNPIADLEVSALMQQLSATLQGGGGVGTAAPKKKVNRYNRLLKAEMRKLRKSRLVGKDRFKLAAKRASSQLKAIKAKQARKGR